MFPGFYEVDMDLPVTDDNRNKEARIVRIWNDLEAQPHYRLYKQYKSWFGANKWVCHYWTNDLTKAKRWSEHYNVKIEL